MKYIVVNKQGNNIGPDNPISEDNLFEIGGMELPREPELSPVSVGEFGIDWRPLTPKRKREVLIQTKEQLLGNLSAEVLYVIDGDIALNEGEHIIVPESGLNIMGYSFDASRIGSYGVPNHKIFTSGPNGSGNLILHNIAFTTTGEGAGVFDIWDRDGSHALEMVTVNFEGCKTLGKITGYRQGTGITIGIYGCESGLELDGAWNGFKLTNTNSFGFGNNGVMFKAGPTLTFTNRFYLDINIDFDPQAAVSDVSPANFLDEKLFQVNTTMGKVNGTVNPETNTVLLFPNIDPDDPEALFTDNIGIRNTKENPYGIKTGNLVVAVDDADASNQGVVIGEVYVESVTGYFKVRLS